MDDKLADRRKHPRILKLILTKQKGRHSYRSSHREFFGKSQGSELGVA